MGDKDSDGYSVRALIRTVLARGEGSADLSIVAKAVFREIPASRYPETIIQLLRGAIQKEMTMLRMQTSIVMNDETQMAERAGSSGSSDTPSASGPNKKKASAYRAYNQAGAAAAYWYNAIRGIEYVNGGYKLLGDCTPEDLRWLRDDRYERAADHVAKGERYGYLADLCERYSVGRIADLPDNVKDDTFRPRHERADDGQGNAA